MPNFDEERGEKQREKMGEGRTKKSRRTVEAEREGGWERGERREGEIRGRGDGSNREKKERSREQETDGLRATEEGVHERDENKERQREERGPRRESQRKVTTEDSFERITTSHFSRRAHTCSRCSALRLCPYKCVAVVHVLLGRAYCHPGLSFALCGK